ncbi:MAG: sigma 54-interacting transcriptional regulator, partial [Planctomycetota bacterium]|nr:sigma 54-interacting transcriptional regulator [Planctomycetota bacterium]
MYFLQNQVDLLRVLEEKSFTPIGSSGPVVTDVRVIFATNRDLEAEVQSGRFREDLYYRLNVIGVRLPALRDRPEDVAPLAKHFLNKYTLQTGKKV